MALVTNNGVNMLQEIGLNADVPIVDPYQEEKEKTMQPICVKN